MNRGKRIVISGAYGMGNLGDEAICHTLVRDFFSVAPEAQITVLAYDIKKFRRAHPDFDGDSKIKVGAFVPDTSWALFLRGIFSIIRADVFVWGGGGIVRNRPDWLKKYITPLLLAQMFGKKVMIAPIGVDVIDDQNVIKLLRKIRPPSVFLVRDEESQTNLLAVRPDLREETIHVVSDPAYHFREAESLPRENGAPRRLGINLTFWKASFQDKDAVTSFVNGLALILNEVFAREPFELISLPTTDGKDDQMTRLLRGRLNPNMRFDVVRCNTPFSFSQELRQLSAFIGMRLHSLILASNIPSLPFLTFIYDEKIQGLARLLPDRSFAIEDIEQKCPKIVNLIENMLTGKDSPCSLESLKRSSKEICGHIEKILL